MGLIAVGGQLGARHRHTIAAAFWTVVGIVALLTLGDALAFLGIALVIVTTAWWVAQRVTDFAQHPSRVDLAGGFDDAGDVAKHTVTLGDRLESQHSVRGA
jgi:hypothetical protein